MPFRSSRSVPVLLPFAALALIAAAEPPTEVESRPPASPPRIVESAVPSIPLGPGEVRTYGTFRTQPTPAESPADRGGLETVGDPQLPQALTAGQLAKLARAREAVERSRAAGNLQILTPPELDPGPPLSPEAIEAMKREKLRAQEPLPYGPAGDASRTGEGE